jgi:hypothetical protein
VKTLLAFLIVAAAVLAPATTALAQDSEEVQRIEIQVQRLRAEVARLNAELLELRERVKMLERILGDEVAPEDPSEEVPDPAVRPPRIADAPKDTPPRAPFGFGGSAAGSYVLDKEHMEAAMLEMVMKEYGAGLEAGTPEEQEAALAQIKQMMKMQIAMMNLGMVLNPDGTFKVDGMMGGQKVSVAGTWTQTGSTVAFTVTHENGEKKAEPETKNAQLEGDAIVLKPDEDMPFAIRMVKE